LKRFYYKGKNGNHIQDNQLTVIEINVSKTDSVILSRQQNAAYNSKILVNKFSENI